MFIQGVTQHTYTLYDGDTKLAEYTTPKADDDNNAISTDAVAKALYDAVPAAYTKELKSYVSG